MTGTIKWFDPIKGWGFIVKDGYAPDDRAGEIFVHKKQMSERLEEFVPGTLVIFDVESDGQRGPRATHVRLGNAAPSADKLFSAMEFKEKLRAEIELWKRATGASDTLETVSVFFNWVESK